jgi:hypothetical protein
MKKYTNLIIGFFLSFLVACSTPEYLTPEMSPLANKPTTNISTETSLLPKTISPKISITSLLTSTPAPMVTFTPLLASKATYLYSSTFTPLLLPITDKVNKFFLHGIPIMGQAENVDLRMIGIGYENNVATNLKLKISIQCFSGTSSCSPTMARDAFIQVFSDPDPQPDKMSMFPTDLEEFQVIGYDENMIQVENIIGKWSDLVEFEKGNLIRDDFLERLICH